MLSALLDRYPSISVSPEVDRIAEILETSPAVPKQPRAGHETAPKHPRSERGEAPPPPRAGDGEAGPAAKYDQLQRVVDDICDSADGITLQLIKGPRLHFHLAALSAAFPGCRFVQIVRDGRAVFASKRRTRSPAGPLMDNNLLHAAWNWRRKLELAAPLGQRLLTIRYEDLVRDPVPTLQQTLDFLGVERSHREPEGEVEDFYRDKIPATHRHLHAGLKRPLSTGSIDAWCSDLSPHEILLYEVENTASLAEYGYALHQLDKRPPFGRTLRAEWLRFACVSRWGLRLTLTAVRLFLSPRVLMRKIRRTHDEFKALRSARTD